MVLVGVPAGPPISNGQWPGVAGFLGWLGDLLPEPSQAVAAPAVPVVQAAQQPPKEPAKRVKELTERRTAHARVWAMSDGTFEAEVSPEPEAYRDGAGVWREIDTKVGERGRDGYRFANERNGFASRFGDKSDKLVRFEYAGRHVAMGVAAESKTLSPKVDGSKVTYPGVFDGADVVYQVTGEALKESIVLGRAPKDATYRFTLQLGGVTAVAQPDGSIGFFANENVDGPPVFVMPRPFMVDAKDDAKSPHGKVFSEKVTQTVEQQGANITVTVKADQAWLAAKERQYPVVIDPTIKIEPTPTTGQDAQIWSDTPDRADGGLYKLSVGTDPWGKARSLLKFDTSVVPAGTSLSSAKVKVYYDNELHTSANNVTVEARRVTQAWAEDTVTWNSINTAVAEAGMSTVVKAANTAHVWHELDVRNIAQAWVSGSQPNHGLVLKATDETLGRGGAIYQAAEYAYNGETATRPKLLLAYGRPSVDLAPPATFTATGAELTWPSYVDPNPSDPNDDIVELQVHRTVYQTFTPSRSTLIAPLTPTATSFADTTAKPTPSDSPDPYGNAYYYMVAAKTRDGQLLPGPTQLARLPKAGLVTKVFTGSAADTTLASNQATTNLDSFGGQPWMMVGNNSTTYGNTRAVARFDGIHTALPAGARILDADFTMWGFYSSGSGVTFDAHALTKGFVENQATWNRASTATAWTAPGGDFGPALDNVVGISNDPRMHIWENSAVVQGWVDNPASNHGYLIKVRSEAGTAKQRVLLLNGEAPERLLRPSLTVTYTAPTAELTYYAAETPQVRMVSGEQQTVPVSITNTTTSTWVAADDVLSYKWTLPDGTDVTGTNRLDTALPSNVAPGQTVTVAANVKTTLQNTEGNKREAQVVNWDLRNKNTGTWKSAAGGPPALPQNVSVEDPTSDQIGLEKFYAYTGKATGAGSNVLVNQYAGNAVFSYDAFSNPGRGLTTFLRLTYNSLDTTTTTTGYGWSVAAAGLVRLGTSLELHPKGQDYPTRVTLPDGDGTSHVFLLDKHGSTDPAAWTYTSPKGVHLYLQRDGGSDPSRRWKMTRPDRTEFWFDDEGWLTATRDRNGNEQTFTYTLRKSNNQPRKFLAYVTDPAGRQSMVLDYYTKADTQNPKIIDQVKSIKDISGRTLTFAYSDKGLLIDLVDGAGSTQPKAFHFDYDATQGNKNVKLVKITDPRGNPTNLSYFTAPVDPKDKWKLQTITDRLGYATNFSYVDPDGPQGGDIETTVTDAENHTTKYRMDGFGRPYKSTNAKNETTQLGWDNDHNVTSLTEANGAQSTWSYDQNTGYPLQIRDAEAVANNTPATVLGYQTSLNGHVAELTSKTSPEGRKWVFGYDPKGNLTTVTDPKGVATTAVPDDYQTVYAYDGLGQMTTATDANGNITTFSDFDPTGSPKLTTDAYAKSSTMALDVRGNPTSMTDARGKITTATYDAFGRPLESRTPKDQAAGEYILTPAPVYDANDNITQATAANGAVSTAVYDKADQVTSATAPKDTPTGPSRTTALTYDKVGNLLTETQPLGVLTTGDPNDYITRNTYDPIYQLTETVNAAGHKIIYSYDNVGNVTTVVDPRKNVTADATDYTAKVTYDRNHRGRTTTDPTGNVSKVDFDRDNNKVSITDAENNVTTLVYDERSKLIEARVPHKAGVIRTTRFEYDEVGNKTKTVTPRGVETTDDPDDFVAQTVYDKLNRPVEQLTPFDKDDAVIKTPDKTTFTYDEVGRMIETSMPPSGSQTNRIVTKTDYFDNGWVRSSTDPWDIVTSYDYNPLGQQTRRTLTSAGGSSNRTMTWDYFPDGKLKSRSDDGIPVGKAVALNDNADSANTTMIGTWAIRTIGTGYNAFNHRSTAAGDGSSKFIWTPVLPAEGTYEVFVKHASGISGDAATNAPYTIDTGTTQTTVAVDQKANGGTWVSLGSHQLPAGNTARVTLSNQANGVVYADAVKFVRDNASDPDTEAKVFTHAYDANANLLSLTDTSPGTNVDAYAMTYNGLNQLTKVEEKLASVVKNTTLFSYNENGAPLTIDHDRQDSLFEYDPRDLLAKVTNTETGGVGKVTTFGYTARGQVLKETKPNGNTVDYGYNLDRSLASQIEKKTGGALVAQHLIDYAADGHRARDAAKIQNADNASAYLDHIYEYGYDPRERLTGVTKKAASNGAVLETETYKYDGNNNVVDQTVDNKQTQFTYNRNRLTSATAGGATARYNYDPFGRLDTVTSAGQITEQNLYDGFDRTTTHKKHDGTSLVATTYVYDPLDRTSSKTDKAGTASAKTTDFAYLGLTDKVVSEEIAGQLQRTYQYDAFGRRLTQVKKDTDGAGPDVAEDSSYGYNPHTDVETLTKDNGDTRATYGYTAYGSNDEQAFTGIDKPDTQQPGKEPFNFYRYNGKRYDPSSGGYDMGFRDYQPSINRFTVRDTYNGALNDLNLGTNPWTGNRYSFTAGNPISRVEYDGHMPIDQWEQQEESRLGGDNSTPHNAVLAASAAQIQVMMTASGQKGTVTTDLGKGGTNANTIPRAHRSGDGRDGVADIILWTEDAVYIWEVKPGNAAGKTNGREQLDRYIRELQKELQAKGDNRIVTVGFTLARQDGIPTPAGPMDAWSETGAETAGLRLYGRKQQREVDVSVIGGKKAVNDKSAEEPGFLEYVLGGAQVVAGTAMIVGTLAEDVATGGVGIADDPATIMLGVGAIERGLAMIGG